MDKVNRNSYSLFQRKTGSQTIWYARFWDDELQAYTSKRSTGQTTKAAAHRQVQQWLIEGLQDQERKTPKVSRQRILTAIRKFLIEAGTIDMGNRRRDYLVFPCCESHVCHSATVMIGISKRGILFPDV